MAYLQQYEPPLNVDLAVTIPLYNTPTHHATIDNLESRGLELKESTGQIRTSVDESDTEQNKMNIGLHTFLLGVSDAVTRDTVS